MPYRLSAGILALLIFAAILGQVVAFVLFVYFRRRREYRELGAGGAASRLAIGEAPASSSAASVVAEGAPAWDGFRDFVVRRREVEDRAGSVCSFYLVPADGQALPPFEPGQFLTFRLRIPDPASGAERDVVRCYSLSDRSRPDCFRVTVKRLPPPAERPTAPPGLSSSFFHDHVQVGARLSVRAPAGHFHLVRGDATPVVLVAGGIGLTPLLSMINSLLDDGDSRQIWLFYGLRNGAEHVMKSHLEALAEAHANFHLHVCYSRPGDEDVEGVDYRHRGHADIRRLRLSLGRARYRFYVCGPRAMMESLVPALQEWGVPAGDIHYEAFGPASLTKHAPAEAGGAANQAAAAAFTVTFAKSGRQLRWNPAAGSLLEFAEDSGVDVVSGCRAGSCGTCQTGLEAGAVIYSQDPDAEIAPGHCLLCISTPAGDLTLDA